MMQNIICPECGAENEADAKRCQACDFLLLNLQESSPTASDTTPIDDFEFSSNEEQDLPDLLHALKQDGDISSDGQVLEDGGGLDASEPPSDASQSEEEIPSWLQRIRDRARKETDAAGEITQKITAAQESIIEGKGETQHEDFASWIQSLRRDEGEEISEVQLKEQDKDKQADESQEDPSQWLSKIRKVKGATPGGGAPSASGPEEKKGDSLLQWLVALEEGKETAQPVPGEPAAPDETPPEESTEEDLEEAVTPGEETQKISTVVPRKQEVPELDVSRAEQLRASLFSSTVVDEQAQRPIREPNRKGSSWIGRLVLSLLLIGAISGALFGGWPLERGGGTMAAEQEAMLSSIEALPVDASLLIVTDYRAGFAEEIHMIAKPIFAEVIQPGMQISLISTRPAGVLLSQRLLAIILNETDLQVNDLGYYPSSIFAAYTFADYSDLNQLHVDLPESPRTILPADLDGVFILADSYEGARALVEQLTARMPDVPLYLLVTAQAGPMLAPYQDSGQVVGMIAGIPFENLDNDVSDERPDLHLRGAYQTGTLLLAVMITIGAIVAAKPKREEKDGESHGME